MTFAIPMWLVWLLIQIAAGYAVWHISRKFGLSRGWTIGAIQGSQLQAMQDAHIMRHVMTEEAYKEYEAGTEVYMSKPENLKHIQEVSALHMRDLKNGVTKIGGSNVS